MSTLTSKRPGQQTAPQPSLPDWRRDPRLAELNRKRDVLDEQAQAVDGEIRSAERRLAAAEAALEPTEIAIMAGVEADHAALDKARAAVGDARMALEEARAKTDSFADERRKIAGALVIVADEAKLAARLAFVAPYRSAIDLLDALLAEAAEASEEIYRIWSLATEQFGFNGERSSRGVYHPSHAGLIRADWPMLAPPGAPSRDGDDTPGRYEQWHREVAEGSYVVPVPTVSQPAPTGLSGVLRRFAPDITRAAATPQPRFVPDTDETEGWVGR